MEELKAHNFAQFIYQLRTTEEIVLRELKLKIDKMAELEVLDILEMEYKNERLNYPFSAPPFHKEAAIWAAKILYFAAQFYLYRINKEGELEAKLPVFNHSIDAGAMLSADLTLRFLPVILQEVIGANAGDPLVPILQDHLLSFHYSAIGLEDVATEESIMNLFENACFKQLYLDRVSEKKAYKWAEIPTIKKGLLENSGNYTSIYWTGD